MPLPLVPIISGVSGIAGAIFGSKKRKAAARAAAARNDITKIQKMQAKRAFFNKFHAAQADALTAGVNTGADLGSSGVQGQLASQATQARVGVAELNRMEGLDAIAGRYDAKAAKYAGYGAIAGAVGEIANLPGISDSLNKFGTKLGLPEKVA